MNFVDTIVYNGESKYIEFKAEFNSSTLKTISAFANYHDGSIFIGITDNGNVVGTGTDISILKLNIENSINDNIIPRPFYELIKHDYNNHVILEIKVYHGNFTPYTYHKRAYYRMDTSTLEVDQYELQMLILNGKNMSFENLICNNQNLEFTYFELQMRKALKITGLTNDLLKTFGLVNNEKLNNAAALLADNNPIETSRVSLLRYIGDDVKHIKDRMIKDNCSVLEQFSECMLFYKKHINVSEIIESEYRTTIEEVPFIAYREAVANAIVHRDYMKTGDIKIEFFDDRIEIISPGGLPLGLSEEEFLTGRISVPRNKVICDIFFRLKIIEKMATGIRRIKEYYSTYKDKPSFLIHKNSITVILPKAIKTNEPINQRLTMSEVPIISYIKDNGDINRRTAELLLNKGKTQTALELKKMVEEGLLIVLGKGKNTKYILRE